jgi:hypothetical protein
VNAAKQRRETAYPRRRRERSRSEHRKGDRLEKRGRGRRGQPESPSARGSRKARRLVQADRARVRKPDRGGGSRAAAVRRGAQERGPSSQAGPPWCACTQRGVRRRRFIRRGSKQDRHVRRFEARIRFPGHRGEPVEGGEEGKDGSSRGNVHRRRERQRRLPAAEPVRASTQEGVGIAGIRRKDGVLYARRPEEPRAATSRWVN